MKKLVLMILAISSLAYANFHVVATQKTGYPQEKEAFPGYYLVETFDGQDKAFYFAEGIKARCNCEVYVLNGKAYNEWLRQKHHHAACLLASVRSVSYPPNFNRDLFIKDLEERFPRIKIVSKEVEKCRSRNRKLEDLLPYLEELQLKEIAREIEKFLEEGQRK